MSKMSSIIVEIQDMYVNGYDSEDIAFILDIPKAWVFEALSMNEDPDIAAFDDGKDMAKCA